MIGRNVVHRDQIHGDATLDPLAVALLNTPVLQRLGRVYQLGYAHLVYRGGNHTRLSHVMGTARMADLIVDHLQANYAAPADERPRQVLDPTRFLPLPTTSGKSEADRWEILRHLVRWAALLHDVGHVPLGHTLEDEFHGLLQKHDDFTSKRVSYLWYESHGEPSTVRSVLENSSLWPPALNGVDSDALWKTVMLIALFKEQRPTENREGRSFEQKIQEAYSKASSEQQPFIEALGDGLRTLQGELFLPYMADIVGNTICADYLDYVRRDPSNVGLDVLRDNRVVRRFYVAEDPGDSQPRMALSLMDRHGKPRLDTCTGVVDLVRQRYRFAEIIYYHKTKVAASAMFAKALTLLKDDGLQEIRSTARTNVNPDALVAEFSAIKNLEDRRTWFARLRADAEPQALLDDDVGDESLHVILQQRAWNAAGTAVADGDPTRLDELFRAISLLRAIQQRHLYKVCATITPDQFIGLSPGTKGRGAQKRLVDEIRTLREDRQRREDIEKAVQQATGGSAAAFILYIPERKSQAKGIETFALEEDGVTTLSNHHAVEKKVQALSDDYARLWRLILLINPDVRCSDAVLSGAFDVLCDAIWGTERPRKHYVETAADCCWFRYFAPHERQAAATFAEFHDTKAGIDYRALDDTRPLSTGMAQENWGAVAYFVDLCRAEGVDSLADLQSGDTLNTMFAALADIADVATRRSRWSEAARRYVAAHKPPVVKPSDEPVDAIQTVAEKPEVLAVRLTGNDRQVYQARLRKVEELIAAVADSAKIPIVAEQNLRTAVEVADSVIEEVGESDRKLRVRAQLLRVKAVVAGEHAERFGRSGEISVKRLGDAEDELQRLVPLIDDPDELDSVADVSRHIGFLTLLTTASARDIPMEIVPRLQRARREQQKAVFANMAQKRAEAMSHRDIEKLWRTEVKKATE
jgi:HD superfamily phosphohydrolase